MQDIGAGKHLFEAEGPDWRYESVWYVEEFPLLRWIWERLQEARPVTEPVVVGADDTMAMTD